MSDEDVEVSSKELSPEGLRQMLNVFLVNSGSDGSLEQTFHDLGDEGRPLSRVCAESWLQVVWDLETTSFKVGNLLAPDVVAVGFPFVGVSSSDVDTFVAECNLDASEEIEEKHPNYINEILEKNSLDLLKRIAENPDNAFEQACLENGLERLIYRLEELKNGQ